MIRVGYDSLASQLPSELSTGVSTNEQSHPPHPPRSSLRPHPDRRGANSLADSRHRHLHPQHGPLSPPRRQLLPLRQRRLRRSHQTPCRPCRLSVFSVLSDRSFEQVASIIYDAAKSNAPAGSNERKIADLYRSYMDEAAIESHGLATR